MSKVIHLSDNNFYETLNSSTGIAIVDFWAPWCGPCRMLGRTLDTISEENANITIYKVNVDECETVAREYNVSSIPMLLYFRNGQLINQSVGNISSREILNNCM